MDHTTHSSPAAPRRPINADAIALLCQAQTGDREPFDQLHAQHVASVRRYVAARTEYLAAPGQPPPVDNGFVQRAAHPVYIGADAYPIALAVTRARLQAHADGGRQQ